MLRERAGAGEVVLELPEGARVRDALARSPELAEGLPLVMAVNREYADEDAPLVAGDELALIPPVCGGASRGGALGARRREPLSLDALAARVRDPRAGAVVTFQGVTREVQRLEYEAYAEMARGAAGGDRVEAVERHGLCAAAVEHRVGDVPLSEPSVAVAVVGPAPRRGVRGRAARSSTGSRPRRRSGRRRSRPWVRALGRGAVPAALSGPASEPQQQRAERPRGRGRGARASRRSRRP